MSKVFISYLSEDKEKVQKIVSDLKSEGVELWWDKEALKAGDIWMKEIKEGILSGSYFIACFSKSYMERKRNRKKTVMDKELNLAFSLMQEMMGIKWFIPVRLDESEVPNYEISSTLNLGGIQRVDLFGDKYDEGIEEINEIVNPESPEYKILNYNPESDGIYTLWDWSYNRGLKEGEKESKLITSFSNDRPPIPDFIDKERHLKLEQKYIDENWGGINYYLSEFQKFDEFGEVDGAIKVKLTPCRYTEFLAYREMIFGDEDLFGKLKKLVLDNPEMYINKNPLPTHVNTNVVVLNNDKSKFLATFRSRKVSTARATWVVSMNETMRSNTEKYVGDTDFFEAMHRGIEEELGLDRSDYSPIVIGYIGIVPPRMGIHVIGIVRTYISDEDLKLKKRKMAKDDYEHDDSQWYPFNMNSIGYFLNKKFTKPNEDNDMYVYTEFGEFKGKKWLHHVPVCLKTAWKMKDMI